METYDELERKMIDAVGRERTDEIRNMAKDILKEKKVCPSIKQFRLISKHGVYGKFGDTMSGKKEVSSIDNGFIESCNDIGDLGFARQFLQQIYDMTLQESIEHIAKVLRKKVVIT